MVLSYEPNRRKMFYYWSLVKITIHCRNPYLVISRINVSETKCEQFKDT